MPTPAPVIEAIQFRNDLVGGLYTRSVTKEGCNIAKVAIKRTSAGELDAHGSVSFQIDQIPLRYGCLLDVCKLGGCVNPFGASFLPICEKWGQGMLGFIKYKMIHVIKRFMLGGEKRPTRDNFNAGFLAASDNLIC